MAEVVASILADNVPELLHRARLATMAGADWLEVRLDRLAEAQPEAILGALQLPVLVACRAPQDGGDYRGSLEHRRELLQRWVDAGVAGLDLEGWEGWAPERADHLTVMIRSHHNLSGIDENLPAIRDQLLGMGANVAKIAVTVHDLAAAAPVLELMAGSDPVTQPTVAFAMGADAWPTRLLACIHGARFVYGSAGEGQETASGQLPVGVLTGVYDVHRFTGSTLIYGVLGNPAHHSWGPWLHNRAFRLLAHDGVYLPFGTARPEDTVSMLSRRRLRGLSITAPHKAALVSHCHETDEETQMCGVLNTISFRAHGVVAGHNTDVAAVREALTAAGLDASGENAVVLGGGGAARAAAVALAQLDMPTTLMPRSLDPVRSFAEEHGFQLARMDAGVLDRLRPRAVVHATPVGGPEDPEGRILPDWKIPSGTFVLDLVYQAKTPLLRDTTTAGGVPVAGLEMFLAQAREQLYLFTGRRLPTDVLADLVGGR